MVRPGRQGEAKIRVVTVGVVVERELNARGREQPKTGVEARSDRLGVHIHHQRPCLGQPDGVEVHVGGAERPVADLLRREAMDGAVAERTHVVRQAHRIARLELGQVADDRPGGLKGPDYLHRRRTGAEVQVVVDQPQIRQIQSGKGRDVSDPVAAQVQPPQIHEGGKWRDVGDLGVGQVQDLQIHKGGKRRDVGDPVVAQVQERQIRQARKRSDVDDQVGTQV